MEPLIKLENISKEFKVFKRSKGLWAAIKSLFVRKHEIKKALDDVSFEVNEGEIIGYIGPNGAGKSTTVKIMSGILTPTSGKCVIDGLVPYKDRVKFVKNIGVVFGQRSQLWWDVPAIDSFELLKSIYKISDEEYNQRLEELDKELKIKELLNVPLRQMSLGQRMKCELCGSLLHNPKILFLDEPTIGLDAVTKLAVREFIKKINKKYKITVILTTHDMNDIEALTDKIILIGKGKLLYQGTFTAIKNKYDHNKIINIEFESDCGEINLKNYELIFHDVNKYKLKYVGEKAFHLPDLVKELSQFKIIDINIEPINVEQVLANLYQEFQI